MLKRVLTVLVVLFFCFGYCLMANADTTYVTTFPDFSGPSVNDPGPFSSFTLGTFAVQAGNGTIDVSGTFGNSDFPASTGGVDVFVGSVTAGYFLVAECDEGDACWTGGGPFAWDTTLTGPFAADTWSLIASQTSQYIVRLGDLTVTQDVTAAPEPSSFMLLGSGLLGAVGLIRRKYRG